MKLPRFFMGTIALCVFAVNAKAQTIPGDPKADKFYAELYAGATIVPDSQLSNPAFSGADVQAEFDTGFNFGGTLGYKMKNGLRIEGEYTYRRADFNDITACVSGSCTSASSLGIDVGGDLSMHAVMANAFWEPRFGNWLPSIGGGAGVGIIDATLKASAFGASSSDNESDTVFAYQAGAGIGYEFSPNIIALLDYRYWATQDPDLGGTKAEISTHNINIGIRYQF